MKGSNSPGHCCSSNIFPNSSQFVPNSIISIIPSFHNIYTIMFVFGLIATIFALSAGSAAAVYGADVSTAVYPSHWHCMANGKSLDSPWLAPT